MIVPLFFIRTYRSFRDIVAHIRKSTIKIRERIGEQDTLNQIEAVRDIEDQLGGKDSFVAYLKLLKQTKAFVLIAMLFAVGGVLQIGKTVMTDVDVRRVINNTFPVPVDLALIKITQIFPRVPVWSGPFTYRMCIESAPIPRDVLRRLWSGEGLLREDLAEAVEPKTEFASFGPLTLVEPNPATLPLPTALASPRDGPAPVR